VGVKREQSFRRALLGRTSRGLREKREEFSDITIYVSDVALTSRSKRVCGGGDRELHLLSVVGKGVGGMTVTEIRA